MEDVSKIEMSKKISLFFHKFKNYTTLPKAKFVKDMVIGLLTTGTIHLSCIARALKERDKKYKHTDKRLRRNIGRGEFDKELREIHLKMNSNRFKRYRYLIIDEPDIQKEYAVKMENIDKVRDGSKGVIGNGYNQVNVLGVSADGLECIYTDLYSLNGEATSQNTKILEASRTLSKYLGNGQILVILNLFQDRGGDRIRLMEPFIRAGRYFIIRLTEKRHLIIDGKKVGCGGWRAAVELTRSAKAIKINKAGKEQLRTYKIGIKEVSLPDKKIAGVKLWLLVSKKEGVGIGKDEGYSYYLGYLPAGLSKEEAMDIMFKGYGYRWKVDEYHRHIKVSFKIEGISFHRYQALKVLKQVQDESISDDSFLF